MMAKQPRPGRLLGYREKQVVVLVLEYYLEHCRAPTRREIQDALDMGSKGEVSRIIKRIEARGISTRVRANPPRAKPVVNPDAR